MTIFLVMDYWEYWSRRIVKKGATIFGYHVKDPERYGVIGFDDAGNVNSIVEKPKSQLQITVTGLYLLIA